LIQGVKGKINEIGEITNKETQAAIISFIAALMKTLNINDDM
jgi:hypothetical protein